MLTFKKENSFPSNVGFIKEKLIDSYFISGSFEKKKLYYLPAWNYLLLLA